MGTKGFFAYYSYGSKSSLMRNFGRSSWNSGALVPNDCKVRAPDTAEARRIWHNESANTVHGLAMFEENLSVNYVALEAVVARSKDINYSNLGEKIEKLRAAIAYHAHRYHTLDCPVISDSAYDALVRELEELQLQIQEPMKSMVGSSPDTALPKVKHTVPMLSLASVNKVEELFMWYQRLKQKLGPIDKETGWIVEPKVDGLALSVRYEHGNLTCAATRGNGLQGEDVTHNAHKVAGLPAYIEIQKEKSLSHLEVRGEIFMSLEDFKELNAARASAGKNLFVSARHAAAGSIRLLDAQKFEQRPLSFVAYAIANIQVMNRLGSDGPDGPGAPLNLPEKQWEALQMLQSLGFNVNKDNMQFDSFDDAVKYATRWREKRSSLEYLADGLVFKVDDLATQMFLGVSGADPRWAVAWKFPSKEAVTLLEAVELSVGRSGAVIPVARLKPVELGGATITQASLHNFSHMDKLGVHEGDHVIVEMAGDIIPQVTQVLKELRLSKAQPWVHPCQCPSCGSDLENVLGKPMVFCRNSKCPSRCSRQIEHFAKTLIPGVGPKVLEQLQEEGLITDPADLYFLDMERLLKLKGFGKRKAENLLSAIENSKKLPLSAVIESLGIPCVGRVTAQRLEQKLGSLQNLASVTEAELLTVEGIGDTIAAAVYNWCCYGPNVDFICRLELAGLSVSYPIAEVPDLQKGTSGAVAEKLERESVSAARTSNGELATQLTSTETAGRDIRRSLEGSKVVITGSFGYMSRADIQTLVRTNGGEIQKSVSSKTSLLVAGHSPGPRKILKAQQLGLEILDQQSFQRLFMGRT